jgi:hypothetical protein
VIVREEDMKQLMGACVKTFGKMLVQSLTDVGGLQNVSDVPTLPFALHLAPGRDTIGSEPCKSCDKILMYERVYAPVDTSLPREVQLMTVNGFVRCMQAS